MQYEISTRLYPGGKGSSTRGFDGCCSCGSDAEKKRTVVAMVVGRRLEERNEGLGLPVLVAAVEGGRAGTLGRRRNALLLCHTCVRVEAMGRV